MAQNVRQNVAAKTMVLATLQTVPATVRMDGQVMSVPTSATLASGDLNVRKLVYVTMEKTVTISLEPVTATLVIPEKK